jgi:hypothetical protein
MLRFEWNTLRVGDRVLVHDQRRADLTPIAGEVAQIDSHSGLHGVGVRVPASPTGSRVLWPSYLAVHRDPRDPRDPAESCWRCDDLAVVSGQA